MIMVEQEMEASAREIPDINEKVFAYYLDR